MHLRNREGRTPLFLAANAGLKEQVGLLRAAGAHLHTDELAAARVQAATSGDDGGPWKDAGIEEL